MRRATGNASTTAEAAVDSARNVRGAAPCAIVLTVPQGRSAIATLQQRVIALYCEICRKAYAK